MQDAIIEEHIAEAGIHFGVLFIVKWIPDSSLRQAQDRQISLLV
jgi:hypothetical protein